MRERKKVIGAWVRPDFRFLPVLSRGGAAKHQPHDASGHRSQGGEACDGHVT